MTKYRESKGHIEHKPTKFDSFTIEETGKPYKSQATSGRSKIFAEIRVGERVDAWTERCARLGYDADFCTGSLDKHAHHLDGLNAAFVFSKVNAEGKTVADVKRERQERRLSPEARAKREQKEAQAQARADKKAAKAAAKEQAKIDREAAKAAKRAQREAEKAAEAPEGTPVAEEAPAEEAVAEEPRRSRRKRAA